jgi:hypothetical protein
VTRTNAAEMRHQPTRRRPSHVHVDHGASNHALVSLPALVYMAELHRIICIVQIIITVRAKTPEPFVLAADVEHENECYAMLILGVDIIDCAGACIDLLLLPALCGVVCIPTGHTERRQTQLYNVQVSFRVLSQRSSSSRAVVQVFRSCHSPVDDGRRYKRCSIRSSNRCTRESASPTFARDAQPARVRTKLV